jgi:hypothetical protein
VGDENVEISLLLILSVFVLIERDGKEIREKGRR